MSLQAYVNDMGLEVFQALSLCAFGVHKYVNFKGSTIYQDYLLVQVEGI